MAHVTLKPGALRELHWHPNADEWQYYIQGSGRMKVFFNRTQSQQRGAAGLITNRHSGAPL